VGRRPIPTVDFPIYPNYSNCFELFSPKDGLPVLKNFQIIYGRVYNCIGNKFTNWSFFKI
jgi:hypothetical protein